MSRQSMHLPQERSVNSNKFRISLGVVILAGAFHLDSARATMLPPQDDCQVFAIAYATSYCTSKGGRPASVTYTCYLGQPATIESVTCVYPT